ncbi:MAG: 3'-5' exonuclease [Microbacteriaceae bacterium]
MDLFQAAAVLPQWAEKLATFDLETTGIDVRESRIVSACIAILDADGAVIERNDWLANPGIPIPPQASAVHGITTERAVAEGRAAAEVVAEIHQVLRRCFAEGMALVIYNAPYDLSLLFHEAKRYGIEAISEPKPIIDPLVIDKELDRFRKGKRTLVVTSAHYGVSLDDAHDAGSDAIAAARVAQILARTYPDQLGISADELHDQQLLWAKRQDESYQDWLRSQGRAGYGSRSWPLQK